MSECCEICYSTKTRVLNVRPGLDYTVCNSCKHAALNINGCTLVGKFEESQKRYFGDLCTFVSGSESKIDIEATNKRCIILQRFVHEPALLLEVGPGSGAFAKCALKMGHEITLVENSPHIATYLQSNINANVIQGTFEDIELPVSEYDVFCSFHVIEHVADIQSHLELAARILKPGGLAFIATPNASSWQQRIFPMLSPNFDTAHLRVFSLQSLQILAERSGWKVLYSETPEYTNGWLRVLTKAIRKIRREDEEITAGKYSRSDNKLFGILIKAFGALTAPIRSAQQYCHAGNEIFLVLQRES